VEPQRVVLRPSKWKWAAIFLACTVFASTGMLMIVVGVVQGWLPVLFFGLGIPLSAVALFSSRLNLVLTADGFTFGTIWGSRTVRWADVNSFEARSIGRTKLVSFETMSSGRQKIGYLSETYGMSARELAEMMNTWRLR
jgi:hypothetical protein